MSRTGGRRFVAGPYGRRSRDIAGDVQEVRDGRDRGACYADTMRLCAELASARVLHCCTQRPRQGPDLRCCHGLPGHAHLRPRENDTLSLRRWSTCPQRCTAACWTIVVRAMLRHSRRSRGFGASTLICGRAAGAFARRLKALIRRRHTR